MWKTLVQIEVILIVNIAVNSLALSVRNLTNLVLTIVAAVGISEALKMKLGKSITIRPLLGKTGHFLFLK
jgi:hypothetical protein